MILMGTRLNCWQQIHLRTCHAYFKYLILDIGVKVWPRKMKKDGETVDVFESELSRFRSCDGNFREYRA